MSTRNIELPIGRKLRIKFTRKSRTCRISHVYEDSPLRNQVQIGDYVRHLLGRSVRLFDIQDADTLTYYLNRLSDSPRTLVVSSEAPPTPQQQCIHVSLPAGHVGLTFEKRRQSNDSSVVVVRRVSHDSPVKQFVEPQSVVFGVKLSPHQHVRSSDYSAHEIAKSIGENRHLSSRVLILSSIPTTMDDRGQADAEVDESTNNSVQADILFDPSDDDHGHGPAPQDDERSLLSATVILDDQYVSAEDLTSSAIWTEAEADNYTVQAAVPLEHRRYRDDDDEETLSPVAVPVRNSFVRDEPLAAVSSAPPTNDGHYESVSTNSPQRRPQSNPYDVDTVSPVAIPITFSSDDSSIDHEAPMVAAAVQVTPSVSGSSSEGGTTSSSAAAFEIAIKGGTNEAQHICIKLEPNEHVSANPDCLIYMTIGVRMEKSESPSTILRRFVYANDAVGERGTLVLGSSTPCKMFSVRLESQGRQLICQRGAVVCCDSSVECTMLEDGSRDLLWLSGGGCVYLRAAGSVLQHHLEEQEVLECSPGALLAFENTVAIRNASLSGTRLVMVQVRGPGMVWMSTSPTSCSSSLRFRGIDSAGVVI